jgi:hypothetical protein
MTNKPIIPIFIATHGHYGKSYSFKMGSEPKWDSSRGKITLHYWGSTCTIEISLDGGAKFYSMERIAELIELGEQYEDLMRMKQDQYEDMNR